jgi:hypothetical protein
MAREFVTRAHAELRVVSDSVFAALPAAWLALSHEQPQTGAPVSSPACSRARRTFLSNLPTDVLGTSSIAT